ncbi:MAG: hypothetical protein ACOC4D_00950, partial [Bacteroidota bacterium]
MRTEADGFFIRKFLSAPPRAFLGFFSAYRMTFLQTAQIYYPMINEMIRPIMLIAATATATLILLR